MLGVEVGSSNALHSLSQLFADKRALLILDGCEHLLEAAAAIAETLLQACPGLAILATSREPLRSDGESLYRLGALHTAPTDVEVAAEDVPELSGGRTVHRACLCRRRGLCTERRQDIRSHVHLPPIGWHSVGDRAGCCPSRDPGN